MRPSLQLLIPLSCILASMQASEPRDTMPDTWAATDVLGRSLPMSAEVGEAKPDRTVGLFYFNRHAALMHRDHDGVPGGRNRGLYRQALGTGTN